MNTFVLHAKLQADTLALADLRLSRLLLMDNRLYPWLVLVPRRDGLKELHEMATADQQILLGEINAISVVLEKICRPDKINIGLLGNIVPQLHVHVVARFHNDPAWPGPVWGAGTVEKYAPDRKAAFCASIRHELGL